MPTLLVSLGTSPAVVPEAFLLPGIDFDAVHVLTTASTQVEFVQEWFAAKAPGTNLTITRVAGFNDFTSEDDHFHFEEVLYRWWLLHAGDEPPYVCLSGGFKTMSAAVQKAAAVLGAVEVFHVLCNLPGPQQPKTAEEIQAALESGLLQWIRLGAESGWPQFHGISAKSYPFHETDGEGDGEGEGEGTVTSVRAPDFAFRDHLREIVERSHRIAGVWDEIGMLPFAQLATWSSSDLAWLREPLDPVADRDWVAALPKVDLHCHLGGFATEGETLLAVRKAAEVPQSLSAPLELPVIHNWPVPDSPISLQDYMKRGDANGSALLKDPGCLRRQCELLYEHLCEQNVVYAEIRCSPANYATSGRSPWTVLTEIKETFDRCHEVAASAPLGSPVEASVPLGLSSSDNPRQFLPYSDEADHIQTWRNLPHRHQPGATAFLTFRLADSLPKGRLQEWERERLTFLDRHPKPWSEEIQREYRRNFPRRLESWLDEAHGACWLRDLDIARLVESALRHFDGTRYVLDHYAILPNHVHVLVKPLPGHDLRSVVHSWKSFSAQEINKTLGRVGEVWEHESFDHLVRNWDRLEGYRKYIRENPEMAGLDGGFLVGAGVGLAADDELEADSASWKLASTAQPSRRLAATTRVNLIIIATRKESGDYRAAISRHLALAVSAAEHWTDNDECRVVGVDLAGYEDEKTRAHYFREEFTGIHRCGLALTVHAGENDEAEGIWRAVFDLNARRLGHALHLINSPELLQSVADRGIGVEMCPYANVQIKGFPLDPSIDEPGSYPLKRYLDAGIKVTVNTDNIGISCASLTDNLLLTARLCPHLTRLDILLMLRHGIDVAFLPPIQREGLRKQLESQLPRP